MIQWRWPIFIGMLVLTAALFMMAPNLSKQAEEAGSLRKDCLEKLREFGF